MECGAGGPPRSQDIPPMPTNIQELGGLSRTHEEVYHVLLAASVVHLMACTAQDFLPLFVGASWLRCVLHDFCDFRGFFSEKKKNQRNCNLRNALRDSTTVVKVQC